MIDLSPEESQAIALFRIQKARKEGLRWLDLGDLRIDRVPEEIALLEGQLRSLALGEDEVIIEENGELSWGYSGLRFMDEHSVLNDLSALGQLALLEDLNLVDCISITDFSPLARLRCLKTLLIHGCKQLTTLSMIADLTSLSWLAFWDTQVSDLYPLYNLERIETLQANGTGISDLSPLAGKKNLRHLELCRCLKISDLSPLKDCESLRILHLSECHGLILAPVRKLLSHLDELFLTNAQFHDVPSLFTKKGNVLPEVKAYFDDLDCGSAPDHELKVFVLGNGRVGKTKLVGRLRGIPFEKIPEGSTHGVRLYPHDLPIAGLNDSTSVRLNLWDFGGQDIYYGTHALFINPPAVYVILWSGDCENDEEATEAGVILKNRRLPYWFDYLRQVIGVERGGKWVVNVPVLLVQCKCDKKSDERQPPYLPDREEFPFLYSLHVSAKDGRGLAAFVEALQEAVAELRVNHPSMPLPESWVKVRAEIRGLQAKASPTRTLWPEEFRQMCVPHGVSNPEVLRDVLNYTGVVFHRAGLFQGQIIVDQSWVLDAVYTVFSRHEEFQKQVRRTGRITREDLDRYFWSKYNEDEQKTFLSFMEQCGVCFRVSPRNEVDPEYIAPDLLPVWRHEHETQFRRLLDDQSGVGASASFGLLHDGLLRGFLAKIGERAGERATYWKFGCHFYDGNTESEALIRADGNTLRMQAWGNRAADLVKNLVEVLQCIPTGQAPAIAWDEKADEPIFIERARTVSDPASRLQPVYPRKVFVSYSHEQQSQAFVEGLVPALEANKWEVRVDQSGLHDGDSIRAFCSLVRECPFLISVVAENYLRKRWCLYELVNFFEVCRCDFEEFRSRALAAAEHGQIDKPEVISQHRAHCEQTYSAYLEEHKYLDHWTERQIRQLKRWSDEVSNLLSTFADELGKFGFENLRADNYAHLITALERKYTEAR